MLDELLAAFVSFAVDLFDFIKPFAFIILTLLFIFIVNKLMDRL